jgi:protein-disulfide isomerase
LDYVCPYSKKTYGTIRKKVAPHYAKNSFSYAFHHQVQPWHPQSTLTHEAGLAVAKVGGEEAFWRFSDAMFDQQEAFFDREVLQQTRPEVSSRLAKLASQSAGVSQATIEQQLALIDGDDPHPGSNIHAELKLYIKQGRSLGIHVSPTALVNGIQADTSSSWTLDQWRDLLDPLFVKNNSEGWTTLLHIGL